MARPPLNRGEIQDLRSVLERALERAERRKDAEHAEKLAREIAELNFELQGGVTG